MHVSYEVTARVPKYSFAEALETVISDTGE